MADSSQPQPTFFPAGEMGRPRKQPRYTVEAPGDRNPRPTTLPPQPMQNRLNSFYYKTRLCVKFEQGYCPYGDTCSYAHGCAELRRPMSRQETAVEQRMLRNRICRKFASGGVCPYGERCQFVHERQTDSSAINIVAGMGGRDGQTGMNQEEQGKRGMCHKWEVFGNCPFGESCLFAHGYAELRKPGGQAELNGTTAGSVVVVDDGQASKGEGEPACEGKAQKKWKGPDKISLIYGDWIDDSFFTRFPVKNVGV